MIITALTIFETLLRKGTGNTHTVRAPDINGKTSDADINDYLDSHKNDIGESFYKVLTARQDWKGFSNDTTEGGVQTRDGRAIHQTVEGFHDDIHVILGRGALPGGSGHIGDPQFAAFDPIFW